MRRRAVMGLIAVALLLPPFGSRAETRGRPWRMPRVERGWVLSDRDR